MRYLSRKALWPLITIASEDAANAVFQNYAGTVKIALWRNLIKILAPEGGRDRRDALEPVSRDP